MADNNEVVIIGDEEDENDGKSQENVVNVVEDEDDPMEVDEALSADSARATRANNRRKPAKTTTFVKKNVAGEQTLRRLLNEATYECDVDPYRGMIRYNADQVSEKNNYTSPWEKSCSSYGIKPDVEDDFNQSQSTADSDTMSVDKAESERSTAEDLVFWACRNQCPSLIQWTQQELDKRKRKGGRKNKAAKISECSAVVGQRPDNVSIRCRCDANPFCLASLGGVMNDIVQRDLNMYLNKTVSNGRTQDPTGKGSNDDANNDDVVLVEGKHTVFSPSTREALEKIRKTIWADESRIRAHLKNTLLSLSSAMSIDECVDHIRAHHGQLIFENPVDNTTFHPGQIQLSIPPGIENLGATCYLNTQLQCLAQNTEFLQGILSWKPPKKKESHDRMTSVLQLFQNLLAEMNAGEGSTISTRQFSDSLGLDHFEQQDPNEFSRLFFERMHESLQQQGKFSDEDTSGDEAKTSDGDSEHDLAQLLPNLFQGVIRYETTCSHCKNVSSRNEEFMDVNLPIAKPEDRKKDKPKSGQQCIMQAFSSSNPKDVDVQFCLDQSRLDELLEGDNKYFCEKCNEKRDANRRVCFQSLPPILNVQLSRYIFDMASLSKKKLSDKVLLSKELHVEVQEEESSPVERKTYVLCAVMKHQGKSAYSGHYIAEAMDWISGEWFEFNDEKVTLLKKGPSNSCSAVDTNNGSAKSESDTSSTPGRAKKPPEGSQDAYNLYYVEESFLAQSVFSFLKKRSTYSSPVLQQMKIRRSESYKELANLCLDDSEIQKRLSKRKNAIMEKLFPPNHFDMYSRKSHGNVWVNGELLRKFLSCKESFESEFRHGTFPEKFLLPTNYECTKHDLGIGPREARDGKFLPTPLYEALVEIVLEEEKCYIENPPSDRYFQEASFGRSSFTSCNVCVTSYLEALQQKLTLAKSALEIYDALDPKEDIDLSADIEEDNEPMYVVSKRFCTSFRSLVSALMKKAASADCTEEPDVTMLDVESCFAGEGLDALPVNSLNLSEDNKEGVDIQVNSLVTCEHGNLKKVSKRNARFVTDSVWTKISDFFPAAIWHPKSKSSIVSNHHETCPLCDNKDMLTDALSSILSDLAKEFKKPPRDRKATSEQMLTGAYMRLVHVDELSAIQKFSNHFKRGVARFTPDSLRAKVEELMCCQEPDQGLMLPLIDGIGDESSGAFLLSRFIRPIRCADHSYPIRSAMVKKTSSKISPSTISEDVAILSEDEYHDFILELATVATIVTKAESDSFKVEEISTIEIKDEGEKLADQFDMDNYHPRVKVIPFGQKGDMFKTISVPMESMTIMLQVDGPVCRDAGCSDLFCNWQFKDNPSGKKEIITVDCDSNEIDNSLQFHIVEADEEAPDKTIIGAIAQRTGLATMSDSDQTFRRSGRKRKTRTGPVRSEESIRFDFSNNVAALRLCLYERIQNGSQYALAHKIKLVIWPKTEKPISSLVVIDGDNQSLNANDLVKSPPKIINLEFPLNERNVFELCKERLSSSLTLRDLEGRIYLVRYDSTCPTALDLPEDDLMQHLISISSAGGTGTASSGNKGTNGKQKQHQPERGFRGTFLSSSAHGKNTSSPLDNSDDNDDVVVLPIPGAISIPPPPAKSALKDSEKSSDDDLGSCANDIEMSEAAMPKRTRFALDMNAGFEDRKRGLMNKSYDDIGSPRGDDDASERLNGLAQVASQVDSTASVDNDDDVDFASAQKLTDRLLSHFGLGDNDRERCYEAVTFALRTEPNYTSTDDIFHLASAKFFDMTA